MIFINYINHYQLLLVPYHILVSYQSKKRTEKKKKKSQAFTLELKERGKITIVEERRRQLVPN